MSLFPSELSVYTSWENTDVNVAVLMEVKEGGP
jgi:hypothetical protein